MWHEARKQEKKIRGILVDYRRRAERRQDFYEKIKADPTQFMQVHGRKCKIHLDPAVAMAGDSPAIMMPWQGNVDNLIDRFDVRAHLDHIPPPMRPPTSGEEEAEISAEERQCNYERYRILAQNDFLVIAEDKFLHQLYLEEQFGVNAQLEADKSRKRASASQIGSVGPGAAIGYTYEENDALAYSQAQQVAVVAVTPSAVAAANSIAIEDKEEKEDSDSDLDVDVSIEISKLSTFQANELNACGRGYGMRVNDFYSFLTKDADEADALRLAREEEHEKIMLSGRKSRRERRAQREKRFCGRPLSPPSYAAKTEPKGVALENPDDEEDSDSRSPSPINSGKITYITSFGGDDELQAHSKISINFNKQPLSLAAAIVANQRTAENLANDRSGPRGQIGERPTTYADKVKQNLERLKGMQGGPTTQIEISRKPVQYQRGAAVGRSRSRSRSRSEADKKRRRRRQSSSSSSSTSIESRNRQRRRRRRHTSTSSSSSSTSSSASQRSSASPPSKRRHRSKTSSTSSSSSRYTSSKKSIPSKAVPPPPAPLHVAHVAKQQFQQQPLLQVQLHQQQRQQKQQQHHTHIIPPSPSQQPEAPIRRYYGRKRDNESSSSLSESDPEPMDTCNHSPDRPASSSSGPIHAVPSPVAAVTVSAPDGVAVMAVLVGGIEASSQPPLPSATSFGKTSATSETKVAATASLSVSTSASTSLMNPRDRLKRKMQILLNKQFKADKRAEIERKTQQIQQQQERDDEMRELALKLRRRQRELRHRCGSPTSSHSHSVSPDAISSDNQSRNGAKIGCGAVPILPPLTGSVFVSNAGFAAGSTSRRRSRSRNRTDDRFRARDRERDRDCDRGRDRDRERERQRERERESVRKSGYRDRERERERDRDRDRERNHRRSRSNCRRSRSRERRSRSNERTNAVHRRREPEKTVSAVHRPTTKRLVDY